ncbi:hypothetical protein SPRG_02008 [Saprolegnia parasitica CBS 223.65]|uniref:Uncharacterized protein n=1 Tax=Saprolegnia parasitica (strain CBS 223.65) TaxID=695850 RepID=A0A067D3B7_SAPPC|nr:hypothetical protein SPRG_02008 [Saprolegnia parasitica CBS 223.65]KDO33196.1 hypothetical protein SPRG_02008 [Saprolegnia parasitica CBS 223.65]|eukprot:XP_012195957.1 hypothetical protein SPRG_02008 [Saprolegnia parasitica CBS 223.65]
MSKLSQWAEEDDADEDENILWDDSTERKLAENHGGFHLRRKSQTDMATTSKKQPPPAPTHLEDPPLKITLASNSAQVVKKMGRKTNKFGLGSPSAPTTKLKLQYRTNVPLHGNPKRGAKPVPSTVATSASMASSGLSASSASSTGSIGTSMAQLLKAAENPEQVRRFLLAEVKQMTIERLVSDAKRFAYLETVHAKTSPSG